VTQILACQPALKREQLLRLFELEAQASTIMLESSVRQSAHN